MDPSKSAPSSATTTTSVEVFLLFSHLLRILNILCFFFFHFSFHLYNISFVLANVLIHFLAKEKRRSRHLVVAFFTNKTKHSVVLLPIFFHPLFVVLAVCVVVDHTITDKHVNPALTVIELNFFFVVVVVIVFVYFSEFLNQKKKFFVFGR